MNTGIGDTEDAAYLVRPDGHIGLALDRQDPAALVDYLERWQLSPARTS